MGEALFPNRKKSRKCSLEIIEQYLRKKHFFAIDSERRYHTKTWLSGAIALSLEVQDMLFYMWQISPETVRINVTKSVIDLCKSVLWKTCKLIRYFS
jgi:hypothetical protein